MKALALIALLALPAQAQSIRVLDGDTIRLDGERVRIVGLDAPELRGAKCERERLRAADAARFLAWLLRDGIDQPRWIGIDRYGRRLARISVDGVDVARLMIWAGHARPYECPNGRCPKREGWC